MTTPSPRSRSPRLRLWRIISGAAVSFAALSVLTLGCTQQPTSMQPTAVEPGFLGVYEFTIDGISTGDIRTSVRRLDTDDESVDRSAIGGGAHVATGITFNSLLQSGARRDEGADRYIYQNIWVDNRTGSSLENLTFLAYSFGAPGPGALGGSAFRLVECNPACDETTAETLARSITPSLGGPAEFEPGNPNPVLTQPHHVSLVAYGDDEIAGIQTHLTNTFTFVQTVLEYGFVVSAGPGSTPADLSRIMPATGGTGPNSDEELGYLRIGFRIPNGASGQSNVNRIVWRGVAVLDDAIRLTLPAEYNTRNLSYDGDPHDNLAVFVEHVRLVSQANQKPVELVGLGEMIQGNRVLDAASSTLLDADGWKLGTSNTVHLPWRVLSDVRIAGGGSTGKTAVNWPLTAGSTPFEIALAFKSTISYEFVPGPGVTSIDYLAIAGGGGGGRRYGAGGGAGGLVEDSWLPTSGPTTVTVGAGGAGGATGGSRGLTGANSSIASVVTALGGGGGGGYAVRDGAAGGSGGGAAVRTLHDATGFDEAFVGIPGSAGGSPLQGNSGGAPAYLEGNLENLWAGGGGGAGAVGASATSDPEPRAGKGGDGLESTITGVPTFFAGGGGGGYGLPGTSGAGGLGGGGAGGTAYDVPGGAGLSNTGGGGGGGSGTAGNGGASGSGIVVLRFFAPTPPP